MSRASDFQPAAFQAVISIPTCKLGILIAGPAEAARVGSIVFLPPDTPERAPAHTLADQVIGQVTRYLDDPAAGFSLPLEPRGTAFQRRVWQAIAGIAKGSISTYGELVREAGGTARAVGQACGANPYPLVVPCHRVVSRSGLGGFAHSTDEWLLNTKRWLLHHEGVL
ncbi:MAG: methylated-DNA--[protein]-cysteine S-methyltransferase [Rhodocyclaceae bacterium]